MITLLPLLVIALVLIAYQTDRPKKPILTIGFDSTSKLGWRIGRISQILDPIHGSCDRCHTTWGFVDGYDVSYSPGSGCFVLCVGCYYSSTLEERIRYYHQWLDNYYINDPKYYEMSNTLMANLRAGVDALKPGTRVLFDWFPSQWVLETPMGSSLDGWRMTPTKGTIVKFIGLENKQGLHSTKQPVPHYYVQADGSQTLINTDIIRVIN